jgi:hypothetical protein
LTPSDLIKGQFIIARSHEVKIGVPVQPTADPCMYVVVLVA